MKKLLTLSKITLLLVITFVLQCTFSSKVSAYTFERTVSTSIQPISTTEVKVTQTHRLHWDNPGFFFPKEQNYLYAYIYPAFSEQKVEIGNSVKNLTVTGGVHSKENVVHETSKENGYLQLKIPYYDNLDNKENLEFAISYTTNLYVLTEGGLMELNYPGLSEKYQPKVNHSEEGYSEVTTYGVSVVVPTQYGEVSSIFPKPSSDYSNKEKSRVLLFGTKELLGNAVHVVVGNERFIKFTLKGNTYSTNNETPEFIKDLLKNYIEVALPTQREGTETAGQEVFFTRIEPFPVSLRTDIDGNVIAKIPIAATSSGQIIIEGYAKLSNIPIKEALSARTIESIPQEIKSAYTKGEGQYWQTASQEILAVAQKELVDGGQVLSQVRKTMAFVSRNLAYADIQNAASLVRLGAKEALAQKVGVCMEYSDLLLTLLRAQGIPTRTVFGDGVGARVDRTLEGIGHQWISVWFPEEGWIPIDPTWSDNNREYIGHDVNHFTWYVASASVNEPNGFNCLSWDATSPCKDALEISTTPVDSIPDDESLLTLSQIEARISVEPPQPGWRVALQRVVDYLGESQLGRILLSKQGLLMLFGLFTYLILVSIISAVSKRIRKKKLQNAASQIPPTV